MADDEGFLRRWSRRKTETKLGLEPAPEPKAEALAPALVPDPASGAASGPASVSAFAPPPAGAAPLDPAPGTEAAPRLPTMEDVAQLTSDSDFSAFVARGVDQAVRRSALKKLFADPHFNVMDRLDIYIDDYNKPSPMPEGMLDQLKHANSFFQRVAGEDEQAALETPPGAPHTDVAHTNAQQDTAGTGNTEAPTPTITTPEPETR